VVDWSFLGLSMPAWVLAAFVALFIVNMWQLIRRR
jgi:disulfide bond formation protein DsbB